MRNMQWQLGILGTISAFAFRYKETKKNLCRCGRSQDLPSTDLQPAVWQSRKKSNAHSTTKTHKITTIHIIQLQQYIRSTNNNTHKTITTIHTVNQQQLHKMQLLATKHARQIRILQHTQKVKTPKQDSIVYSLLFIQVIIQQISYMYRLVLVAIGRPIPRIQKERKK